MSALFSLSRVHTGLLAVALAVCSRPVVAQNTASPAAPVVPIPAPVEAANRLTLAQALTLGQRDNPLAQAASAQEQSARDNLVSQRAPLNPTLSYGGIGNTPGSYSPFKAASYAVNLTLETSGRQTWRTRQARQVRSQADADADTVRLTLGQTIADAYVDLQAANASYQAEQEAFATAERLADLTRKQADLGAVPESNAIRTQVALAQEQQNLATASTSVRNARAALDTAVGRPADAPVDAADPLDLAPQPATVPDATALERYALDHRSEVRSGVAAFGAAQAGVSLARSNYFPDVVGSRDFQRRSQVQVGLVLPLLDFGSVRGAVNKARDDARAQNLLNESTRKAVLLSVATGRNQLQQAQQQLDLLNQNIVPQAESLLKKTEEGYRLGGSTILDLIDAQNTLRTARASQVAARADCTRAYLNLLRAVGVPSSEITNPQAFAAVQRDTHLAQTRP